MVIMALVPEARLIVAVVRKDRLRSARKQAGITQVELAERTGLSQVMISSIETGLREGSLQTLAKFAKVLGVPVAYLSGEDVADWVEGAGREGILKDAKAAPGLRELAKRVELCEALMISVEEWNSLRSLDTEVSMTLEGYVALLMLIRRYRVEK